MSSHKNLAFFNKSGDSLNLNYNENTQLFEGSLLFDENSTDTFKTYALYTLEKVPTFEFESIGDMGTNKFQLFNEFGIHFYGSKTNVPGQITNIEPVNNDSTFYSKWIYGEHFEVKFPVGTLVVFNNPLFEFSNSNQSFVVVGSKKNAIMIISTVDNSTFETTYYNQYSNISTYIGKFISSVDAIGVYNYINTEYVNNISDWSEPNFYDKLYVGKKLNVINTLLNDGAYSIENTEITDIISYEYSVNKYNLPSNSDLIIEVKLGTDLPKLYDGGLTITSDSKILINDYFHFPKVLKSGQLFKIVGSMYNQNFLTIKDRIDFETNNNITYYNISDQVTYKGKLYECILGYTHSHASQDTMYINPASDIIHWSNPTHLNVNEITYDESLLYAQLYLTTDRYYYTQISASSSTITMASIADKYNSDFQMFNIDLYYENDYLKADLIYPSRYAIVNFYHTQIGETYSIGGELKTFERLISTKEVLQQELNYDFSERFKYNIVFTDLDEYGLKLLINKQVYEEEIAYIYSGSTIDMSRTIDRTLRNWLSRNYLELYKLGINAELQYTQTPNNSNIMFFNSVLIITEYPNVPITINEIKVGSTANCYIEHSRVLFNDLGPSLNININNKDYIIQTTNMNSIVDIPTTLNNWSNLYSKNLLEYGIVTEVKNNLLLFNIKQTDNRLYYTISTGKINLPGIDDYKITKKMKGNDGVLIASNEVILSATASTSFDMAGFATGMVFSINNTYYPYVNQEYSIEFLGTNVLNLSYQGPFWDVNNFICNKSPFVTIAFSSGFGQTGCGFDSMNGTSGEFDVQSFSASEFNINFSPNTYNSFSYTGVSGMVDIKYIELSNCIYVYGDSSVGVIDSYYGLPITTINLPGNIDSIKMEYNIVNNYVYCLSKNLLTIFDPVTNFTISNITLINAAFDLVINSSNGDVYISYSDISDIHIFSYDNLTNLTNYLTISSSNGKMIFHEYESDIYITSTSNIVSRINGDTRRIIGTFLIPGLLPNLFYEPVNKSVYVYGDNVYIIDNNMLTQSDLPSSISSDLIFNNLTGELNVSDSSNNFTRVSVTGSVINYTDVSHHGFIGLNPYDGSIYLSATDNNIVIIDPLTNSFVFNTQTAITTKLSYNPDRKSMWFIQPSTNKVVEIEVMLNNNFIDTQVTSVSIETNTQFGSLHPDYVTRPDIWLKTRDYFRRPRENFNNETQVKYYFKWLSDNVSEFFLYDYSGTQLQLSENIYKGSPSYSYTGITPLSPAVLNKNPNNDITKVSYPGYQQTIFDKIEYTLSYIDDENDISTNVEPLSLFVGFQSQSEGALRSILQLYKKEDISFIINSTQDQYITLETLDINGPDKRGQIKLSVNATQSFNNKGLNPGQNITIYIKDSINNKDQYISHNNASMFIIREVYTKTLIVDFFDIVNDLLETETTIINNHPKSGDVTYLSFRVDVEDKEIGRFYTYGQTEEEDIRFKIELGNVGKLIDTDHVFIFKQYDILEGGIDWTFLNRKRKEMLMMKHLIYPYIGSYKSIINAINFFGYNDLQLNEYYKNVDTTSSDFTKLFKVEIPDIFDNTVEGWTENDFIKHTMPNDKFEGTNLFNLSYFITDINGANVLTYSLDEIIIKLQGLKYWLEKNIIPLTHKILDITGRVYLSYTNQILHKVNNIRIVTINENMTPVSFKMNEVYLMPVNSGSTVYNCVLDFYSIIPGIGTDKDPLGLVNPPLPYNGVSLVIPDYFNIRIRTYKTYKEWAPFKSYMMGDRISYYGILYESTKDNNKINSPSKYELVESWKSGNNYELTSIVEYNNNIYVYNSSATQSTIDPYLDSNWLNITEWMPISWDPVQTISEYRKGNNLLPFNFTLDSNLDPFVVIEVTSDNGYGSVYRDRKNYEVRGTKDLTQPYQPIESIGPFTPIVLR